MSDKPTMTDVVNTLTGYDEIAIAQAFGKDFTVLLDHPTTMGRALVFVLERRGGLGDGAAKKAALDMPLGVLNDYFADEVEDANPDEPDTPAGEGDSQPA